MPRRILTVAALSWLISLAISCEQRNPAAPTQVRTLDQLLQALRQQGLTVRLDGEIPPEVNRFFSVSAQLIVINDSRVNAFEYPSPEAAAADAALVSPDGQPGLLTRITWVSTPRFYRQGRLIVLYVGCSAEIVRALEATIGPPFVIGLTPCR